MTIEENQRTIAIAEHLQFQKEKKKLENMKTFNRNRTKDEEETKKQVTYYTHDNYVLLSTPLYEFHKGLKKVCSRGFTDSSTNKTYFLFSVPKEFTEFKELKKELKQYNIDTYNHFILTTESQIKPFYSSTYIDFPNFSEKFSETIVLLNSINSLHYKPKPTPKFTLFLPTSLDEFLKIYGLISTTTILPDGTEETTTRVRTLPEFFERVIIPNTLQQATCSYSQEYINTITAKTADIVSLFPSNHSIKSFVDRKFANFTIAKDKSNLTFTFTEGFTKFSHNNYTNMHRIDIPVSLFLKAFHPQGLGKNGLNFLLSLIYGYHGRNNLVKYKPSTFIKSALINTNRGTTYTLDYINKRFEFLKQLGLISTYELLTKDDLKNDKAFKVRLVNPRFLLPNKVKFDKAIKKSPKFKRSPNKKKK